MLWKWCQTFWLSALLTITYAVPALAATNTGQVNLARLAEFEAYLNNISTVEAEFVQLASTGQMARGKFFMSRPGRMRVDYAPPSPILIVADGTFLVYFDRKLGQVSYLPLNSTPADVLLDENIRLNEGDLRVVSMSERDGLARIAVHRHESPSEGRITLVFSTSPIALERWEVVDSQGVVTSISLKDARFGVPLDETLFEFEDPAFFRDDLN